MAVPSVDPTPVVKASTVATRRSVPAQPGVGAAPTVPVTTVPVRPLQRQPCRPRSRRQRPHPRQRCRQRPHHRRPHPHDRRPAPEERGTHAVAVHRAGHRLRLGGARMVPGRQVPVAVAVKGVAATTTGVLVRIVARNVTTNGWVSVRACSAEPTSTTSLSFAPGQPNATTTIVPVAGWHVLRRRQRQGGRAHLGDRVSGAHRRGHAADRAHPGARHAHVVRHSRRRYAAP